MQKIGTPSKNAFCLDDLNVAKQNFIVKGRCPNVFGRICQVYLVQKPMIWSSNEITAMTKLTLRHAAGCKEYLTIK